MGRQFAQRVTRLATLVILPAAMLALAPAFPAPAASVTAMQHSMKTATGHAARTGAVTDACTLSSAGPPALVMPDGVKDFVYTLSGSAESPPNGSPATGSGNVRIDTVTQLMTANVSFSGLVGNTTAAHIHSATAVAGTGTAGVATTVPTFASFPLGVTSGTYLTTLDMTQSSSYNPAFVTANGGTTASAFAALCAGIDGGKAYFNIHTSTYPGGEIRGFLIPAFRPRLYLPLLRR